VLVRLLSCLGCLTSLLACLGQDPGTPLGTFSVTGALKTQTCGSVMPADDPWAFNVRLSRTGDHLFWLQAAAPPLSGTIEPDGHVVLTTTETFVLQEGDAGADYCGVIRSDDFEAMFDNPTTPSTFVGRIAYHYDLDQGANCPGMTLPCDVSYDLVAKRQ
jgi:hypothetical protein